MADRDYHAEIVAATLAGDIARVAALAHELAAHVAHLNAMESAIDARRAKDRERKRRTKPAEPAPEPPAVPQTSAESMEFHGSARNSGDTLSPLGPPFPLPEPYPLPPYNPPSPGETPPARASRGAYPAEFEAVWAAYPKRAGDNPKRGGFRAWQASIRRGHQAAALLDGLHRYAKFCEATNLLGTQFVKQAATFFGPDEPWSDAWDVPLRLERGKPARERNYDDPTRADYVGVVDGVATDELWRISAPRAS